MSVEAALDRACADVGIRPPKGRGYGRWLHTDTLAGRNGKGDGRVIINETHVTAWNWQTGESVTVGRKDAISPSDRRRITRDIEEAKARKQADARRAAIIAATLIDGAESAVHPYLSRKGFPAERVFVLDADRIGAIAGTYLVPPTGNRAIVIPARIGARLSSAQLIWEDGTKKFIAGGEIWGGSHRIARGADTWLCEGLSTALSLRAALKGMSASASVICCFSASNLAAVARSIVGRCFIAADNDNPLPQFGGRGAGEHYARATGRPWTMPPDVGTDFNDLHVSAGVFAMQRHIATFIREATMPP